MTIKVTVHLVPSEQFGLTAQAPTEDAQMLLLRLPQTPRFDFPDPSSGAIEVSATEDAPPISYGVPQLTGAVTPT